MNDTVSNSSDSTRPKRGFTVQQAIDKAGGLGRYQCLLLLVMIISNNAPGLVVYGVAFYELQPPYLCTYSEPPSSMVESKNSIATIPTYSYDGSYTGPSYITRCDFETICATGSDQDTTLVKYEIDTSSEYYIYNWIESLNMTCTPKSYIGMLGALAFLGAALSCFFAP